MTDGQPQQIYLLYQSIYRTQLCLFTAEEMLHYVGNEYL